MICIQFYDHYKQPTLEDHQPFIKATNEFFEDKHIDYEKIKIVSYGPKVLEIRLTDDTSFSQETIDHLLMHLKVPLDDSYVAESMMLMKVRLSPKN